MSQIIRLRWNEEVRSKETLPEQSFVEDVNKIGAGAE